MTFGVRMFAVLLSGLMLMAGSAGGADIKTKANPKDGLTYAWIPPGTFLMGCVPASGDDCYPRERPQHPVTLTKGYWMGQTEVTVAAFRQFVAETGYRSLAEIQGTGREYANDIAAWRNVPGLDWETPFKADEKAQDDWPALQITWFDAKAYCNWAGGRLPSEAEWERAARGGVDNQIYIWGNEGPPEVDGVKYENGPDASTKAMYPPMDVWPDYDDGYARVAPVAQFEPNGYGLYDMNGNAKEWTRDWWDETLYDDPTKHGYPSEEVVDPDFFLTPRDSATKVYRGGGWNYAPRERRLSYRFGFPMARTTATIGIRCVMDDL